MHFLRTVWRRPDGHEQAILPLRERHSKILTFTQTSIFCLHEISRPTLLRKKNGQPVGTGLAVHEMSKADDWRPKGGRPGESG